MLKAVILHPSYLLTIQSLAAIAQYGDKIVFEKHDNFQKQTYRSRCIIATDQGKLNLSLPVKHQKNIRQRYNEVKSEGVFDWNKQHLKSITTAYRTSPYFEFFEPEFKELFASSIIDLFEHNIKITKFLCDQFRMVFPNRFTESYQKIYSTPEVLDLRHLVLCKGSSILVEEKGYPQVFEERTGFLSNLSAIDLLFNLGPRHGLDYLKKVTISVPF
jgi:hypothetical protein